MGLADDVALETSGLSSPVGVEVKPEHVVLIKGLSFQPLFEIFAAILRKRLVADAPVQFDVVLLPTVIPSVDVKVGALDDEGGVGLDGELAITPVKSVYLWYRTTDTQSSMFKSAVFLNKILKSHST